MFNQAFVNIKLCEFNLTLKKVVLKKGICIKKKNYTEKNGWNTKVEIHQRYLHKEKNYTEKNGWNTEVEIHQKK